jgi:hypothetical protein
VQALSRSATALVGLVAALASGCEKPAQSGELTRGECVQMVVRLDELKNKELGRVNSVEQRGAVDHCMAHGSRAQLECVNFANNAGEVARCQELEK